MPDYWARYEADETLREMPDAEPAALADELERSAASYDDGAEMAAPSSPTCAVAQPPASVSGPDRS